MNDRFDPYTLVRFFSKVRVNGKVANACWLWTATTNKKGYGSFRLSPKKIITAHRFAYITFCEPLTPGELVCHKCDVPRCVNPAHLFRGTHADNVADCIAKNRRRYVIGTSHHRAKLSTKDVMRIRNLAKEGIKQRTIAAQYGISQYNVWSVVNNKTWRHVGGTP